MDSTYNPSLNATGIRKLNVAGRLEIVSTSLVFVCGFMALVTFRGFYAMGSNNAAGYYRQFWFAVLACFVIVVFGALGSISILERKSYTLALAGGVFTSCIIVGIPALVLIVQSRKYFSQLSAKTGQIQSNPEGGKSRTNSLLLAIFITPFTWLYTYKKDWWKFWVGLAISLLIPMSELLLVFHIVDLSFVIIFIPAIWIWAVIDVSQKNEQWYKGYPLQNKTGKQ
jgi:hypothetical protein